jgi:hypothetical protein
MQKTVKAMRLSRSALDTHLKAMQIGRLDRKIPTEFEDMDRVTSFSKEFTPNLTQ